MHIIFFSPIRFDYLHQRPQKLAARFLADGHTVTYIQPTGFRDIRAEKNPLTFALKSIVYHLLAPLSRFAGSAPGKEAGKREVKIISMPVMLPVNRLDSRFIERLNASVLRVFLQREVIKRSGAKQVAIVINPFWGRILRPGEFDVIAYDCLDDISLYAGNASLERFRTYEKQLLESADVVITTAAELEQHLRSVTNKPVHRIPNGVDDEWFRSQAASEKVPAGLDGIRRPIAGYVGSIAGWLDYELIAATAQRLPDVSFVFVGPIEHDERKRQLLQSPNIHWLGRKPYADMPLYINAFDSCLIPFKAGDIARTTNPVKIFEYFALGKPVVSTRLLELEQFETNALVLLGDTPEGFAAAVKDSLRTDDARLREERVRIATQNSWKRHAESFIAALERRGAT